MTEMPGYCCTLACCFREDTEGWGYAPCYKCEWAIDMAGAIAIDETIEAQHRCEI